MYEAVNWETFLAFNNSFGLPSIPTGATLSGAPGPGTIQVGNLTPPPPAQWDTGPVFGNLSPSSLSCADPATGGSPCAIMGVYPKITTPYVTHWAVSLQQALGRSATLEVAYVGNHGSNLIGIRDINQPPMGSNILPSCATDPICEQHARPFASKFPYLSNIFQMGNIYQSNYNGLQATLTTRNYHGLSMVAGYTWSHALDDVAANWDFGYGYGLPVNSRNPGAEYASSDFDIRNRFTLLITYALPGKKSFAQLLEGWQINSIVTVSSPQPWGPIDLGTDVSGTGSLPVSPPAFSPNRWDFFGNPGDFTSTPVGIPFFPGTSNPACAAKALALDGGTPGNATASLSSFGCYAAGGSIMIPPPLRTIWHHAPQCVPRHRIPRLGFLSGEELEARGALGCTVPGGILQHFEPSQLREPVWRAKRLRSERSFSAAVWLWLRDARRCCRQPGNRIGREPRGAVGIEVHVLAL